MTYWVIFCQRCRSRFSSQSSAKY